MGERRQELVLRAVRRLRLRARPLGDGEKPLPLRLGLLPVADVLGEIDDSRRLPPVAGQGCVGDVGVDRRSIRERDGQLSQDCRLPGIIDAVDHRADDVRHLRHQLVDRAAEQLGRRRPAQLDGTGVHHARPMVRPLEHPDADRRVGDDELGEVPLSLGLRQRGLLARNRCGAILLRAAAVGDVVNPDLRHRPPDRMLGTVPEEPLRCPIPADDGPLARERDGRVSGGLDRLLRNAHVPSGASKEANEEARRGEAARAHGVAEGRRECAPRDDADAHESNAEHRRAVARPPPPALHRRRDDARERCAASSGGRHAEPATRCSPGALTCFRFSVRVTSAASYTRS